MPDKKTPRKGKPCGEKFPLVAIGGMGDAGPVGFLGEKIRERKSNRDKHRLVQPERNAQVSAASR